MLKQRFIELLLFSLNIIVKGNPNMHTIIRIAL